MMHFRCFADDQNKKLILGRNILTEIFLAQLLEGAVSAQLVDGAVEGVEEGRVFALDDRDRNVRSIFGLGDQLEVGVRMDVQVVVEGDGGVQGGVDPAGQQQLDGLVQVVHAGDGGAIALRQGGIVAGDGVGGALALQE